MICAHYIPHSKILFENRLFSNRQLCICTYWRYMCIYTSTCYLYLYIDNQIFCLHISLNEIHNCQTVCQISTSAPHQLSVHTIYHISKSYFKTGYFQSSSYAQLLQNIIESYAYACMRLCLCTLYITFQTRNSEPAIFNQTVMHNCYKNYSNSWICMHAALFLPASSPCIALSK